MNDNGWISIHRKLLNWQWYSNYVVKDLFLHLLIKANHKDGYWQGRSIKRGQLATGRKQLSIELGFSEMKIRTGLKKLKLTNEITIEVTNRYSIIELRNYDQYQGNKQVSNQQVANKEPANNQQVTTNNNDNNDNNDKKYIYNDEHFFLAKKFYDLQNELYFQMQPKQRKNELLLDQWADGMRKLIKLDKFNKEQILAIISWLGCGSDQANFWRGVTLTPISLRKKNKDGDMRIRKIIMDIKRENYSSAKKRNYTEKDAEEEIRQKYG